MSNSCAWLPPLLTFSGDLDEWHNYIEKVYEAFKKDFIYSYPELYGRRVGIRKYPIENSKEQAFFHLTTMGENNTDREYDLRRCERIAWPKPIIEHAEELKIWKSSRKTKRGQRERLNIATPSFDYLVIVEPRKDFYTLITAFFIEYGHAQRKKEKEYKKSRGRT